MATRAIEIEGLTYRYEAMEMRFDLTVEAGAFVVLFGPSGAGKSTLLNLIAGFEAPLSGSLRLLGRDALGLPPAARPVTTLFQDHNLFPHLTAAKNVALGLHPGRLSPAETAQVTEALAHVDLQGLEARRPAELSGGERQRVALARSLVRDRPILLLDEPFAALGPAQRREMVGLVDRLRRERGLTVLMVSHQLDALPGIDAQAAFVEDGRIAATGPATELLTRPPLPEIADYLGYVGPAGE
ncbi:thiamine ABC transporter ATP-binding protein [Inquilinus sp. Marseille-Q2685]|uniref:thiamine ABC transporter ATP-binding protein n=1 Tax=Inquilinus sp. Marseille-Q2685 TaxID=2866581 RepID=UPI001CE489F0|nr:thiamine ABC transporter ATP-binding protein [Inquilinus sp. Marseille-Q2685]